MHRLCLELLVIGVHTDDSGCNHLQQRDEQPIEEKQTELRRIGLKTIRIVLETKTA